MGYKHYRWLGAHYQAKGNILMFRLIFIILIFARIATLSWADIIPNDREIDWTNAGLVSIGGIPPRDTMCVDVTEAPYNCVGDDVADDSTCLQNAVNDCANTSQYVYIPSGTYRVTAPIDITSSNITVRGDGPSLSKIRFHDADANIFRIGNFTGTPAETALTTNAAKGDTTISVVSSASFSVDEYILIDEINDGTEVYKGDCTWCSRDNGDRLKGQIVKITAINGNDIDVDPPLYQSYTTAQTAEIAELTSAGVIEQVGVEDLYIERVNANGGTSLYFQSCAYCWAKNLELNLVNARHVEFRKCFRCEIRDSYIHDGHNYGGGQAYGIACYQRSTEVLIQNNRLVHLRHAMVSEPGKGCVFGYNYSIEPYGGVSNFLYTDMMANHAGHSQFNLFEGNYASRANLDNVHGSSADNTFLRNHITRISNAAEITTLAGGERCFEAQEGSDNANVVGNVLGTSDLTWTSYDPGATRVSSGHYIFNFGFGSDGDTTRNDTVPGTSAIIHGNWDEADDEIKWDGTISDQVIPNSYYLTGRPDFFGGMRYPPFDPESATKIWTLPAQLVHDGGTVPANPKRRRY